MNLSDLNTTVTRVLLLAQDGAAPAGDAVPPGGQIIQMVPMLIAFVVMFYFIVLRPQQREQKERAQRLASLKKNDKVVTIGGIIGTIVDLSGDGTRVTLRVDDGTRIKFIRSSIQGPYEEKSESESSDK